MSGWVYADYVESGSLQSEALSGSVRWTKSSQCVNLGHGDSGRRKSLHASNERVQSLAPFLPPEKKESLSFHIFTHDENALSPQKAAVDSALTHRWRMGLGHDQEEFALSGLVRPALL